MSAVLTRCKMILHSITKSMGSKYDPELVVAGRTDKGGYVPHEMHSLKFGAVADGSEENKRFFLATPSGTLELSTVNAEATKHLELNRAYYIDITPAP